MADEPIEPPETDESDDNSGDPEVPVAHHRLLAPRERSHTENESRRTAHFIEICIHALSVIWWFIWLKVLSNAALWTAAATVVIALVAMRQLEVYRQQKEIMAQQKEIMDKQKKIMESGSGQTDKLISFAKSQSDAATDMATAAGDQVDAANNFADSAEGINIQTAEAVGEFKRLADDTERSIQSAQNNAQEALNASIAASQLDQRAWVGVSGERTIGGAEKINGTTITFSYDGVEFDIFNSGKTPALKMSAVTLTTKRPLGFEPIGDYDSVVGAWKEQRDTDAVKEEAETINRLPPELRANAKANIDAFLKGQPKWDKDEEAQLFPGGGVLCSPSGHG